MIIYNLDIKGIIATPLKANSPFIVNQDRVLPGLVTLHPDSTYTIYRLTSKGNIVSPTHAEERQEERGGGYLFLPPVAGLRGPALLVGIDKRR